MRRPEDHAWRASSFRRFLPSSHAQTPAIAAFETGKVELRNGRAEIVAGCGTEAKKLLGHHRAHGVQPVVARTGAAVAIPIEAGARLATAAFEFAAEDIRGISHALILHRQSRFCRVLLVSKGSFYAQDHACWNTPHRLSGKPTNEIGALRFQDLRK